MTTDEQDPLLQKLFDEANYDFDEAAYGFDEAAFTARVMARTRFSRYRVLVPWAGVALLLAAGAWYLAIPLELAQLVAQVLTTTLIDLGDSWLAWVFSPVNNIAALFVLGVKAIRVGHRRITGASYAN
jgi:hypothetical protein